MNANIYISNDDSEAFMAAKEKAKEEGMSISQVVGSLLKQWMSNPETTVIENPTNFHNDLKRLINTHSMENGSNTQDLVLAEYIMDVLTAFERAVLYRDRLNGR